jgi:prepilin peptidase CpaA
VFPYALVFGMSLFLALSAWFDHRARRIPNSLVVAGVVCALLLNSNVLFDEGRGFGASVLGMLIGFAIFLPLYVFRIMGAGDVKLVAMVGAFVGQQEIVGTVLAVLVAGGGLAIVRMVGLRSRRRVLANIKLIVQHWLPLRQASLAPKFLASRDSADRMPYAYAVTIGALGYQWLRHAGV